MIREKPRYEEVKERILDHINQDIWGPGHVLPTELELAEEFGCARATVSRALGLLADDGLIERRRKAGSRVREFPLRQMRSPVLCARLEIENAGACYRYIQLMRRFGSPPDWVRKSGGLESVHEVLHLQCAHFADSVPYQHEEVWINCDAMPNAVDQNFSTMDPGTWLLRNAAIVEGNVAYSAVSADRNLAKLLDAKAGAALMRREITLIMEGVTQVFIQAHYKSDFRLSAQF